MTMTWGFLQKHRMFDARVTAVPRGFKVDLLCDFRPYLGADFTAQTVNAAMRGAVKEAQVKLDEAYKVVRTAARKRILARKAKS